MRTWWDLKWKKNVCNQFCVSFSSYPSYLRCSTHNSTIMWCFFFKERHCKSSIRNSQDAIFMQIALCAKLRNLRTTENTGNVGRMHLKCKSFLGVVNSSLRSLLPAPFSSFSLWLLWGKKKKKTITKLKRLYVVVALRNNSREAIMEQNVVLQFASLALTKIETTTMPQFLF